MAFSSYRSQKIYFSFFKRDVKTRIFGSYPQDFFGKFCLIDQLKKEGYPVNEADIAHLSPVRYEHINPYGKYSFNVAKELNRKQLRLLKKP